MDNNQTKSREIVKIMLFWLFVLGILFLGIRLNDLCEPLPVFHGAYFSAEHGWTFGERGGEAEPAKLSDRHVFQPGTVYVLSTVLQYDGKGDPFPSAFISNGNLEIEVYVDGESVFRHSHDEKVFKRIQSVGKCCVSIPLGNNCGGRLLTIELRNPMDHQVYEKLPGVTLGDSETQSRRALLKCMPSLLLSSSIACAVVILILLGNTVDGTQWTYIYFSLFALCMVLFQIMHNLFILYVWAKPFMAVVCEYFGLLFSPVPLLMSYRFRLKPYYQKTFDILVTGSVLNLLIQTILHFYGIRDVVDMKNIGNFWFVFVCVFMIHMGNQVRKATGQQNLLRKIIPIFVGIVLEILHYNVERYMNIPFYHFSEGAHIGIGLLISLTLMILEARKARIGAIRETERNTVLEKVAYTDALTGISNRAAFTRELSRITADHSENQNLLVVSADLNGLKSTNDSMGHGAGDELICRAARLLHESLSPWGSVFRTGGDEFFAILRNVTEKKWQEILNAMEEKIKLENGSADIPLSIAVGAAKVDKGGIHKAIQLSDRKMYEKKAEQHEAFSSDA